jgi:hypothetical protein
MEPIALVMAAGAVAAVAFGVRVQRKQRRAQEEVWSRAAALLGGRYAPRGTSFWRPAPARIEAELEHGVAVVVDHYTVSTGKSSVTFTRLQAQAPGAGELSVTLREEGTMAAIGKALGLADIDTGDPAFDTRFLFRSGDVPLARAWVDPRARAALLAMPASYTVALKDGQVIARRRGIEMDVEGLVAAVRAIGALSGGGRALMVRWRALAGALGGKLVRGGADFAPGEAQIACEHEGRLATVETAPSITRVRVELGQRDAPIFRVLPGEELPPMGSGARHAWEAVQPATLECDGESVLVAWDGYQPDEARVRAALLLAVAARPADDAPYR